MVSTYGYATLANLEKHAVKDYSAIDTALTDAVVEDKITDAEKFINGYVGTTFTGTIPDDIELLTKKIAKIFLDNYMYEEKIGNYAAMEGKQEILSMVDIVLMLEKYKKLYGDETHIWVSKHTHVNPTYYRDRRPTGW